MTTVPNLTPELVKKFYADACKQYRVKLVDKDDSELMKLVGIFLDGIGILDKEDFLKRFTTTVGRTVFHPYDIGVPGLYNLWDQIAVMVHEIVHVLQYDDDELGFPLTYALNPSSRAEYEAKAYAADMEMYYWIHGRLYNIKDRAQLLENYGLEQEHIDYAASVMESIGMTIEEGAAVNEVAAWAMDWLEEHGIKPLHA